MRKNAESCVILCGGKSSRMGQNKALLRFGKTSLITYQFLRLREIFERVFISCKDFSAESSQNFHGDFAAILEALRVDLENLGLNFEIKKSDFILESEREFSPLFGIKKAFEKLKEDRIFFISCDCPFVSEKTMREISQIRADSSFDIVFAKDSIKSHPLIAVWGKNSIKVINENVAKKNFKIMQILESLRTHAVLCDLNECENLNQKCDYERALGRLRGLNGTR